MAEISTLLRLTMESAKPVDELKVAIVTMANLHSGKQLEIYKALEMWLSETIVTIENQTKPPEPKEGEQNAG